MSRVVDAVRRHAVITAAGAVAVLAGAGVGTAAVVGIPATQDVSESTPATSSAPAATTPAPEPVVEAPVQDTAAATVDAVTEPEPAAVPEQTATPAPAGPDLSTTWTDEAGNTYLPAPEVPVEKLDGEIVDQDPALD